MLKLDVHTCIAQMFGQLLGEINRAVLPAGAAKRYHEIPESAGLIVGHAGIDERNGVSEKIANARLLFQIFNDGGVFSGEGLETLFASGIGKAATIEDEAASVAGVVDG